jgi:hypothetical protein
MGAERRAVWRRTHRAQYASAVHRMREAAGSLRRHGPAREEPESKALAAHRAADEMRFWGCGTKPNGRNMRAVHHMREAAVSSDDVERRRGTLKVKRGRVGGTADEMRLGLRRAAHCEPDTDGFHSMLGAAWQPPTTRTAAGDPERQARPRRGGGCLCCGTAVPDSRLAR